MKSTSETLAAMLPILLCAVAGCGTLPPVATKIDEETLIRQVCLDGDLDALLTLERQLGREKVSERIAAFPFQRKPLAVNVLDVGQIVEPRQKVSHYPGDPSIIRDGRTIHVLVPDQVSRDDLAQPEKRAPSEELFHYFRIVDGSTREQDNVEIGLVGQHADEIRFVKDSAGKPCVFVHLLADNTENATSPSDPQLYTPGHHSLLLFRQDPAGKWVATQPAGERKLGMVTCMKVWPDSKGVIHLAWSERERTSSPDVIRYRAFDGARWSPEEIIPTIEGLFFGRPVFFPQGDNSAIAFVATLWRRGEPPSMDPRDQSYSDKELARTGVYSLTREGGRWSAPRKVARRYEPELFDGHRDDVIRAALASGKAITPERDQWSPAFDNNGRCHPAWCMAPDGRQYAVGLADEDNLVLKRDSGGTTEGLLLLTNLYRWGSTKVDSVGLLVDADGFIAAWMEGYSLRLMASEIPPGGWTEQDKLSLQLRAGRGFGEWDYLEGRMLRLAESCHRRRDAENAVKWHLRALASGGSLSQKRLTIYYQAGINEARRQLWAYALEHPAAFGQDASQDTYVGAFLRSLGIRPDARAARPFLSLPPQDAQKVGSLLAGWEWPAFSIPLDGGRTLVVHPDRWAIVNAGVPEYADLRADEGPPCIVMDMDKFPAPQSALRNFKVLCAKRVPRNSDDEYLIGLTKLLTVPGGDGGPGYYCLEHLGRVEILGPNASTAPANK